MNKSNILFSLAGALLGAGVVSAGLIPQYQAERTASLEQEKRFTAALDAVQNTLKSIPAYRLELIVPENLHKSCSNSKVDTDAEVRSILSLTEEELKALLKKPSSPLRGVW